MKALKLLILSVFIAAALNIPVSVSAVAGGTITGGSATSVSGSASASGQATATGGLACGEAQSSSTGQAKQGLNIVGGLNDPSVKGSDATSPQCDGSGVKKIIATAVSILSYVIGIAAIIMLLVSAYKYITSGGDSGKISSAKSTLIYVIVGLLIAALAQFLVNTTLKAASSATVPVCKTNSSIAASSPKCK